MSAPDTNIDTQHTRHRTALWGIKGAMGFGALMLLGLIGFNMMNAGDGAAVTNTSQAGPAAPTDVYAPGTNAAATPTVTE